MRMILKKNYEDEKYEDEDDFQKRLTRNKLMTSECFQVDELDYKNTTPLKLAIRYGQEEIEAMLRSKGAKETVEVERKVDDEILRSLVSILPETVELRYQMSTRCVLPG